jgi:TRAP-type C4-dicarboxylate transport system permease small subunit
MKKWSRTILLFWVLIVAASTAVTAQCSICTKTASQLGEKPARSLNSGIIYLMLTPFAIVGFIGYQWWKSEKENNSQVE